MDASDNRIRYHQFCDQNDEVVKKERKEYEMKRKKEAVATIVAAVAVLK